MLKVVLGDETVEGAGFEWFSEFESGPISVDDAECSGCPWTNRTDENVDQMKLLWKIEESLSMKLWTC